mmetsp:Transcript_29756/g.53449  ORF Transcript_29756/g.53449 Transcript_29756/m.53449 type:complete len:336 (-) Transcript_29756:1151-2158(-)
MPLPTHRISALLASHTKATPWEGVQVDKMHDVPALGLGQCLVAMQHAPINPADINVMEGTYFCLPEKLPAVLGMEGCGQIIAIASDVENHKVGDLVVSLNWVNGTYTQYTVVPAENLIVVPQGVSPKVACMMAINPPSAWGLVAPWKLNPGEWIVQNAANSGVGLAVMQIAKALGLNVLNIVRRPEAVDIVRAAGGEHVFVQDDEHVDTIKEILGDGKVMVGLNAVGGAAARWLCRWLSPGATLVTYGAMSKEPIPVGGGQLIFKDLRFIGFHLNRWWQSTTNEEKAEMWEKLFLMCLEGSFAFPIEHEYPIGEVQDAIQHALREGRQGKVILNM